MLYTISIIAQKGWSEKTTLALTLAVAVEQASRTAVCARHRFPSDLLQVERPPRRRHPTCACCAPARLPGALTTTAAHDVDVVVIDTPARSEHAALEAARAAD